MSSQMAEVIDLTVSPQPEVIELSSDHGTPPGRHSRTQGNKKRKKKRKASHGLSSDGPTNSSTQPSRAHSLENANNSEHRQLASNPPISRSPTDEPGVFFFDDAATLVAGINSPLPETVALNGDGGTLLLPSHVTIFQENGPTPTSVIPPPDPTLEDEQYIEYLDYEDRKGPGSTRYFDVEGQVNQSRSSIFKCKNCGAEGDHKTYDCPVQICLTCGARDEHSTRSCPISKTCYTCGMKGHINKMCPNRFSARTVSSDIHGDCDRCGSAEHNMNECPTLWRIYQYVDEEEHILIMQSREQKKWLEIGEGGEGYIGEEMWCYNCANTGHLGDDCDERSHPATFPTEHSAFSSHNIMSGPFYDPATEPVNMKERGKDVNRRRSRSDWEASTLVDVGKRGKNKDKERLEKRFREQEDESEDWFNRIRNVKKRDTDQRASPPPRGRKLKFGSLKDGNHKHSPPAHPLPDNGGGLSLLERLGDTCRGKNRGRADRHNQHEARQPFGHSIRIRGAASDRRNQATQIRVARR